MRLRKKLEINKKNEILKSSWDMTRQNRWEGTVSARLCILAFFEDVQASIKKV